MDLLRPNLGAEIEKRHRSVEDVVKARPFEVGNPVMTRDHRQGQKKWKFRVIVQGLGPVTQNVEVAGKVRKRHVEHSRDRSLSQLCDIPGDHTSRVSATCCDYPIGPTTRFEKGRKAGNVSDDAELSASIQGRMPMLELPVEPRRSNRVKAS